VLCLSNIFGNLYPFCRLHWHLLILFCVCYILALWYCSVLTPLYPPQDNFTSTYSKAVARRKMFLMTIITLLVNSPILVIVGNSDRYIRGILMFTEASTV